MNDATDTIQKLAQSLWEKAGRPEGRDEEFWFAAERLISTDEERAAHPKPSAEEGADKPHPAAVVGGD